MVELIPLDQMPMSMGLNPGGALIMEWTAPRLRATSSVE